MPKAVSKAQAGFFGLIAGGRLTLPKFSRAQARKHLRGVRVKALPARKGKSRSRAQARKAISKAGGRFNRKKRSRKGRRKR